MLVSCIVFSCQSRPPVPADFIPCCIPYSKFDQSLKLLMSSEFYGNLIWAATAVGPTAAGVDPLFAPKTLTTRCWCDATYDAFKLACTNQTWIRVGGQGHECTWGWVLITSIESVTADHTTIDVCRREGRPEMTINDFNNTYILRSEVLPRSRKLNGELLKKPITYKPAITMTTKLWRVSFEFRVCHTHKPPSTKQQTRRHIRQTI